MSSKWKKTRHDHFYKLAKEQGFRSRAAFKLIQINKKYDFLGKCKALLDLCAAPGGWCQVARKFMPVSSLVIGVDLLPMKPMPGVITLQHDITTQQCKSAIKKELQTWDVDAVVHDGSPNIGGSTWSKDAYTQMELVIYSLRLATQFLRSGGTFVTKVFRSQDYNALLWVLKQFFKKVEVMKPSASREASAEIFAVCLGYLAPAQIDPKLLDPNEVFKQVPSAPKKLDVFNQKQTRNRSGYEDDKMVQSKSCSVAQFVLSEEPIQILGSHNSLEFDQESDIFTKHAATTVEIRELSKDLKVLGKGDFANLLKWRKKLRDFRAKLLAEQAPEPEEVPEVAPATEEQKDEAEQAKLSRQLAALQAAASAAKKRELKKKKERKTKQQRRQAMSVQGIEGESAENLFALAQVKDANTLDALQLHGEHGDPNQLDLNSEEDFGHEGDQESEPDPNLDDDERRVRRLEKDMDYMYQEYKKRRKIQAKSKAKLGLEGEEDVPLGDDEDGGMPIVSEEDEATNPLMVPLEAPEQESGREKASRWFGRDTFQDMDSVLNPADTLAQQLPAPSSDSDDNQPDQGHNKKQKTTPPSREGKQEARTMKQQKKHQQQQPAGDSPVEVIVPPVGRKQEGQAEQEDEAFQEVAAELSEYSSDSDAKAEVLAMGTLLLKKRSRENLVNDAYNRYAFNEDAADLPEWFRDDQRNSSRKQLPITKELVDSYRAQLKAVNARPIKKIAEAKARKKMKTVKRWEKIKGQATAVADNAELAPTEKIRAIQKLYKKTDKRKEKVERVYVVSKKGGGGASTTTSKKKKGKVVKVDTRMKKDKRAEKRIARKAGIRTGGPGKRRPKKG